MKSGLVKCNLAYSVKFWPIQSVFGLIQLNQDRFPKFQTMFYWFLGLGFTVDLDLFTCLDTLVDI